MADESNPLVGVVMGSKSDWETMKHCDEMLTRFGVPHECKVMSAHRTPGITTEYASSAEARGVQVLIAAAGGAAHLAGVVAAHTLLPVLGVPIQSAASTDWIRCLRPFRCPAGFPLRPWPSASPAR